MDADALGVTSAEHRAEAQQLGRLSASGGPPASRAGPAHPLCGRLRSTGVAEESVRRVGRYRLLRCIGQGGMGRVWLARDELLDRDVAVKEMLFRVGLSESELADLHRRVLREAQAAARLDHPHVVRVYDVITVEDRPWIVMQHVPSRSLHRVLTDDGPLPVRTVACLGVELVEALRAAHRVGVLHRDVTPRNVLIADDGRALLSDFGVAAVEGAAAVSQSWGITAAPQYVAPERVRDGVSSPATDLWALGATLYAAVEGRPPYQGRTIVETLLALATEPPDRMRRAGPLAPVIAGLLERDARRRMTAAEAARRLRKIAGRAATAPQVVRRGVAPADADASGITHRLPGVDTAEKLSDTGGALTQVLPSGGAGVQSRTVRRERIGRRTAATFAVAVLSLAGVLGAGAVGVRVSLGGLYDVVVPSKGQAGGEAAPATAVAGAPQVPGVPCLTSAASVPTPISSASEDPEGHQALPPGWFSYLDEAGFTLGLPEGWMRFTDGGVVCLSDPRGERVLAVDLGRTPQRDPSGFWRAEADRLTRTGALPGYEKVSIGPVIRPGGAAEWEFTWDGPDGQRRHARRLLVNGATPGRPYELSWVTPDAEWSAGEPVARLAAASFRTTD
ncbi:serine/threonine-protein kinase [Micromonospora mangrovi]|uniref:non-specific serine/threonine protein kinase n=2 Tax=Micromonospora TaxID=1873 RepID=A0AAU8HII1_9ACTN